MIGIWVLSNVHSIIPIDDSYFCSFVNELSSPVAIIKHRHRKWALSVNPLEAIIVLAILSDVKIIKNYPIVTVTVDNTTILHCQFFYGNWITGW